MEEMGYRWGVMLKILGQPYFCRDIQFPGELRREQDILRTPVSTDRRWSYCLSYHEMAKRNPNFKLPFTGHLITVTMKVTNITPSHDPKCKKTKISN